MRVRRFAWVFFAFGVVFEFLEVLRLAFTLSGLPVWLNAAGLTAFGIGFVLWAFPVALNSPPP
jgi:hypothetical protein